MKSYKGHRNTKNFVGLTCEQPGTDYFACGSEDNNVYVYYRNSEKPIAKYCFGEKIPAKIRGLGRMDDSIVREYSQENMNESQNTNILNSTLNQNSQNFDSQNRSQNQSQQSQSQNQSQNQIQNSTETSINELTIQNQPENTDINEAAGSLVANTITSSQQSMINRGNLLPSLPPRINTSSSDFISAVCWKKNSSVIAAANSQGMVKLQALAKNYTI